MSDKIRLLVIDDEASILETVRLVFSIEPDFEVATLADVRKWRECVERFRPDVILVDYRMPAMSGEEFLQALHASGCCPELRAAGLFSATPLSPDLIQSFGADAYFQKPFQIDEMVSQVRSLAWSAPRKAAA